MSVVGCLAISLLKAETPLNPPLAPAAPADILNEVIYDFGDRFITVQEVTDNVIPTPPKTENPAPTPPSQSSVNQSSSDSNYEFISFGVTVYFSAASPARSFITYTPKGGTPIEIWSSADWRLLTPFGTVTGNGGKEWGVLMMPSFFDLDKERAAAAAQGQVFQEPEIPIFSDEQASFAVTDGAATPLQLEPISALHQKYNQNYATLLTQFQTREAERLQREAELAANPPVPQDIIMRVRELTVEEIEATKPDAE